MTTPTSPGTYTYTDPMGAEPQRLEVVEEGGELCARFVDDDGDVELVPVRDMAGTWD